MTNGRNANGEELNAVGDVILRDGVNTFGEFIDYSREAMSTLLDRDPLAQFYLSECEGCCSNNPFLRSSYRFFTGEPYYHLDESRRGGHMDTGMEGFIVKIYNQPSGASRGLAEVFTWGEKDSRNTPWYERERIIVPEFINGYMDGSPGGSECYRIATPEQFTEEERELANVIRMRNRDHWFDSSLDVRRTQESS